MARCKECGQETNRLFGNKCNVCLCRGAVAEALDELTDNDDGLAALLVNSPITPSQYVEIVHQNKQLDWGSYIH